MLKHILVVDDDDDIRGLLSQYLESHGYIISQAQDAKNASALLKTFVFDLIILDVLMPHKSGIEFLAEIKTTTPVLMLTALCDVDDRIKGLENGADDYMVKPFEPKELLLRAEKLMSRLQSNAQINVFEFGNYRFNAQTGKLTRSGESIPLTTQHKELLKLLLKNAGNVLSREKISFMLSNVSRRSVDTQITRLRNKIEDNPKNPRFIQTIRNKGYVMWV